jgi:hypothetical protein
MPPKAESYNMAQCRTYGHAWEEFFPDDMGTPMYGWRLSLRCLRCNSERHDTIDALGRVNGRRYIYEEGYQMSRDERPDRETLRREMYARIKAKLTRVKAIGDLEEREAS